MILYKGVVFFVVFCFEVGITRKLVLLFVWSVLPVVPAARSVRRGFKCSQSEGDFDIIAALKG